MTIKNWPAQERPREKLLKHGVGVMSDAELLAILLQTGIKGSSALSLSRQLLSQFGSLAALMNADESAFCQCPGLGPARYAWMQAAIEAGRRRVYDRVMRGDVLQSPEDVRHYLSQHLSGLSQEVFAGLLLDNRHRVIEFRELSRGTIDSAAVYPREVVKHCLIANASAVIFAHNHPSGVAEPSDTDVRLTRKLTDALALIDIRVLDHLVIGQGQQTSMAERGLI